MPQLEAVLRKELRTRKVIDPDRPVVVIDDGSARSKVAQLLLSRILRGEVRLVRKRPGRGCQAVQATSLEREIASGLGGFLEDAARKRRMARVMSTVPEEMIAAFAKHHGIPVEEAPPDDVLLLIERLQEKQPQTKAALSKSLAAIQTLTIRSRKAVQPEARAKRPRAGPSRSRISTGP